VYGSWFGHRGETCELCSVMVTWVRPVSFGHFGYRGETCELCSVLAIGETCELCSVVAIGVRPVSWWPLVIVG
jgi:hypothetical protein